MSKPSPIPRSVPNGANYWAGFQKEGMAQKDDGTSMMVASAMVDGRPPGMVPNSEVAQWQALSAMRSTGDPRFNTPEAQAAYAQLALKFGAPPPWQPQVPYGAITPGLMGR